MRCGCGKFFRSKKGLKIHRGNTHRLKLNRIIKGDDYLSSRYNIFSSSFAWGLEQYFASINYIGFQLSESYD